MMMDTPSICDWDGCGMPPDGGEYRQIGEGGQAHFHCEMCNREGNWSHVNAEGHLNNLKHYLCVTGQTHLLRSASPNGLTTTGTRWAAQGSAGPASGSAADES